MRTRTNTARFTKDLKVGATVARLSTPMDTDGGRHGALVEEVRAFLLEGARMNESGDPQLMLDRYLPDAPIVWTVWGGEEVTGGPQDFLGILRDLKPLDPPPDPDPVLEDVDVSPGEPTTARGDMIVKGRDGQRSRLCYKLVRIGDDWRIAEMRGRFVDDGAMALQRAV